MKNKFRNNYYCSYCFDCVNEDECNCCCHDNEKQFLPVGFILNGTVIVGALKKSTGYYSEYLGFDPKTKTKLLVKEFNPLMLVTREENGYLIVKDGYEKAYKNALQLFINKMQILQAEKSSQNVFTVRYAFLQNNTSYFITEYNNEAALKDFIADSQRASQKYLLSSLYNSLQLMKSIHRKGFVHCNISDETVFVSESGIIIDGFEPTTDELGVFLDDSVVLERPIEYLPKSYFMGDRKNRSIDFFSLGLILYSLATGKKPADPFSQESQIDINELEKCSIDRRLVDTIACMCMTGEKIYCTEDEIILDLVPLLKKNGIEVPNIPKEDKKSKKISQDKIVTECRTEDSGKKNNTAIIAVLLVIITVLLAMFFVYRNRNKDLKEKTTVAEITTTTVNVENTTSATEKNTENITEKFTEDITESSKRSEIPSTKKTINTRTKSTVNSPTDRTDSTVSKRTIVTEKSTENVIIGN